MNDAVAGPLGEAPVVVGGVEVVGGVVVGGEVVVVCVCVSGRCPGPVARKGTGQ